MSGHREEWRVYEWFSYLHWGMFRLPLFSAPDWFVSALHDVDDEDIEVVLPPPSRGEAA